MVCRTMVWYANVLHKLFFLCYGWAIDLKSCVQILSQDIIIYYIHGLVWFGSFFLGRSCYAWSREVVYQI